MKIAYPIKIKESLKESIYMKAKELKIYKFRLSDLVQNCIELEMKNQNRIVFENKLDRVATALVFESDFLESLRNFCNSTAENFVNGVLQGPYFIADFANQAIENNWESEIKSMSLDVQKFEPKIQTTGILIKVPKEYLDKMGMVFWSQIKTNRSKVICRCLEIDLDKNEGNFSCEQKDDDEKVFLYIPKPLHSRLQECSKVYGVNMIRIIYKSILNNYDNLMSEYQK